MQVEVRGDSVIIDGYVNAVGRDSRPIRCQTGDFVEQVEPGVFGKALKRAKNIKLLLNHRTDRELGSTAQGNLTLTEDNIGLRAHAEVGDPEIIRKARNKQLSGWSFGMYVNESEMEQRSNTIPRRRLKDIDMFEVSIIDTSMMPCYAGTSVECRAEGENALLETRAFEDTVEMNEVLPENYFEELEARAAQLRAECELVDMEKRVEELRYNPYHDPTNGRFTSASGGGGGYLFVGKGEKGKGQYVFDRDIDSEYDEWKKSKSDGVSAEDKAVREATGGVVQSAAKTTVEATVRKRNKSARPEFDKTVLEAKVDSDGNIILDYAKGDYSGNYGDEYQTVTYNIQSGFVDGEPVNLDLSKAKTISGKTYDARQAAKAAGMNWDSAYSMYISKDHLYNVDTTFSREKFEKMSDAEVDRIYHASAFKSYLDSNNYTFAEASAKAKKLKPRSKAEQIDRMEKADKNNKLLEQQREKWAKTPWAGN